jgi:hypothetical protein
MPLSWPSGEIRKHILKCPTWPRAYEKIRVYREWTSGRNTVFREPQKADMRNDRLEGDFSNLGLWLVDYAVH